MFHVRDRNLRKAVIAAVRDIDIPVLQMEDIGKYAKVGEKNLLSCYLSKENLLLGTYLEEINEVSTIIGNRLSDAVDTGGNLEEKVRLCLETIWDELLSDSDRLNFFEGFYRADYCGMAAWDRNYAVNTLAEELAYRLKIADDCRQSLYDACSVLYEAAYSVVSGKAENTGEYRKRLLDSALTILKSGSEIQTA